MASQPPEKCPGLVGCCRTLNGPPTTSNHGAIALIARHRTSLLRLHSPLVAPSICILASTSLLLCFGRYTSSSRLPLFGVTNEHSVQNTSDSSLRLFPWVMPHVLLLTSEDAGPANPNPGDVSVRFRPPWAPYILSSCLKASRWREGEP